MYNKYIFNNIIYINNFSVTVENLFLTYMSLIYFVCKQKVKKKKSFHLAHTYTLLENIL